MSPVSPASDQPARRDYRDNAPLCDRVQKRDGRVIGHENVEPPPAVGIGFQTVQETMAVVGQFTAKAVAASVRHQLFGSPRLCRHPPVIGGSLMVIRRRNTEGTEIGE
jgi:hypothetical protein